MAFVGRGRLRLLLLLPGLGLSFVGLQLFLWLGHRGNLVTGPHPRAATAGQL